jgi:Tol biopolymer transport system component
MREVRQRSVRAKLARVPLVLAIGCMACSPFEGGSADPETEGATENEWVVFTSARSGNGDLYAVDIETGSLSLVVGTEMGEGAARFDPARRRIVHHRFRDDRAILVANGVELFDDPNGDVAPQWSIEGRIVYALEADAAADLFVADALGEDAIQLTRTTQIERYPAWSPDGQRVVYARRLEEGWDLHAIDVATGRETRLTFNNRYVGHPSWSPDGTRIAFDTMVDDHTDIAVLDLESGAVDRLTSRAGNDLSPAWSADGTRIAFAGDPDGAGNWDVWVADVGDRSLSRLTEAPGFDGGPVFVPGRIVRGTR